MAYPKQLVALNRCIKRKMPKSGFANRKAMRKAQRECGREVRR
jgi:hypothetical protein